MENKLFTVVNVNKGGRSTRIEINTNFGAIPGNRYYQKKRPDGVIELIPECNGVPKKLVKKDYKNAILTGCERMGREVDDLNNQIEKIIGMILEIKWKNLFVSIRKR